MKVGIVTIYDLLNYGNRLQNYATEYILKQLGHEPHTLILREFSDKDIIKLFLRMKNVALNWNWKQETNDFVKSLDELEKKKYNRFKAFSDASLNIKKYSYWKRFPQKLNSRYNMFFAGSDQIWNPYTWQAHSWEFLMFADKKKRNSWAASFGVSELGEKEETIKVYLNEMNNISVREDDGAKIVEKLTGRKAELLIDPTLMLSTNEWLEISSKPEQVEDCKPFILTYFLGKRGINVDLTIADYIGDSNVNVFHLNDKESKNVYTSGPSEFIWLFSHADLILTDSFHACVFAFLFNKPFVVYDREGTNNKMNSRINTFLAKFHLERKYANSGIQNVMWEHEYAEGYEQLEIERKKVMDFLQEALGD